ncbi:MAG: sulfate reduction electron transfer complex DsrMKJOP subunit DsrO [bacterium]
MSEQRTNAQDPGRRGFLGRMALIAGITVAPGIVLRQAISKPDDQAVSNKTRWGILVDTSKCADGCDACVTACNTKHGLKTPENLQTDAQYIRKVTIVDNNSGVEKSLPMMCQHCESPPCVDVCPTGASFKREDGIVLVDKHLCIGCRYCMMACPYKARSFAHEDYTEQLPHTPRGKGTVESCNMCVDNVDKGELPACVSACGGAGGALTFGDLNDPQSEISKKLAQHGGAAIRADLGLNPGVRYQGL